MEIEALTRPAAPGAPLVLALHGQWEDEHAWPERLRDRGGGLTWVFPRGPYHAEAERRGRRLSGRSWYEYTGDPAAFAASLRETGVWLLALLDRTLAATRADPTRVFVLGFSQGGYQGGSTALLWPERFAGAAILGSRFKTELLEGDFAGVRPLRLFSGHGVRDRSVRPEPAAEHAKALIDAGVDLVHKEYACGHRVLPAMIDDALMHLLAVRD